VRQTPPCRVGGGKTPAASKVLYKPAFPHDAQGENGRDAEAAYRVIFFLEKHLRRYCADKWPLFICEFPRNLQ
jgi:hypothetical protein